MDVTGQARAAVIGEQRDEVVIRVHGLDGAEAKEREIGFVEDLADDARQRGLQLAGLGCEIAAPAAEVDAGEDQFIAAGGDKAANLREDTIGGQTARGAARFGNDAERAAVAATLLDLEIGACLRAGMNGCFFKKRVREAVIGHHDHLR